VAKYDYICEQCKTNEEITKSMSDSDKRYCKRCGAELRRIYNKHSGKFILKGNGFHNNDYSK